jgi:hypothetical protein
VFSTNKVNVAAVGSGKVVSNIKQIWEEEVWYLAQMPERREELGKCPWCGDIMQWCGTTEHSE